MSNPEELQQNVDPLNLSELLEALEAGERDPADVQRQLGASLTSGIQYDPALVGRILTVTAQVFERKSGSHFCKMVELLGNHWVQYGIDDFKAISRNWEAFGRNVDNASSHVVQVYSATRREALDPLTSISKSQNRMLVNGLTPVRLCSSAETINFADKAHLCPKNGKNKKAYTWIYAAAAVLGMPFDTQEDRIALCKAICGSVSPGNLSVIPASGLNRSPFNLLSFLDQEVWFDKKPGVVVLPVMNEDEARGWNGQSYEILILCNDVPGKASAHAISERIGLTTTKHNLIQDANRDEVSKAVSLLSRVVKASAFCLEDKEGPDGGRAAELWTKFQTELAMTRQMSAAMMDPNPADNLLGRILVPIAKEIRPEGKMAAKIDLAMMIPVGDGVIPAFPDPLLLAYKSSINWTRYYRFQLMAEAEPSESDGGQLFPDDVFVPSDEASKVSGYSSLY